MSGHTDKRSRIFRPVVPWSPSMKILALMMMLLG